MFIIFDEFIVNTKKNKSIFKDDDFYFNIEFDHWIENYEEEYDRDVDFTKIQDAILENKNILDLRK